MEGLWQGNEYMWIEAYGTQHMQAWHNGSMASGATALTAAMYCNDGRVENVTVAAPAVISKSIFTRAGS